MAEQFQAGAAQNTDQITLPGGGNTTILTLNPLTLPYGNGAARVSGVVVVTPPADATDALVSVFRNADADNILVARATVGFADPATRTPIAFGGVDQIPDGRDCSYSVTVSVNGSGDDSIIQGGAAYLEATLLSGAQGLFPD